MPRTRSSNERSVSGTRRRRAGERPSSRNAWRSAVGEVALEVVVAHLRVAAGGAVARLDLLGRRVALVEVAGLGELPDHVEVEGGALRLAVRRVRSADALALIAVNLEPAQRLDELLVALLAVARGVGVLDAEDELAARVARVGPVEERRADEPHVRRPGRGRAEPDADVGAGCGGHGVRGCLSHPGSDSRARCPQPPRRRRRSTARGGPTGRTGRRAARRTRGGRRRPTASGRAPRACRIRGSSRRSP